MTVPRALGLEGARLGRKNYDPITLNAFKAGLALLHVTISSLKQV